MQKIVYIAALGHSGSTILDMSLGCHPKIVGLGEVDKIINAGHGKFKSPEFNKIMCSCGKDMHQCDFWAEVRNRFLSHFTEDVNTKYQFLLEHFAAKYGEDVVLVDSSKGRNNYLEFLHTRCDLYIIFLLRDFRSWIYSRYSRHGQNMFRLAARWMRSNLKTKRYLTQTEFRFINIGYEELAIYTEIILGKICDFVGVPFNERMLEPNKTNSHIIRGNVSRGDKKKAKGFFYDARWLTSTRLNLYGSLLFPLMKWNRDNVYQNILIGKTKAFGVHQRDFLLFGDKRKEDMLLKLGEAKRRNTQD